MTTEEAKVLIKTEYIESFRQWLDDEKNLGDWEYGRKYGYGKGEPHKDNIKGIAVFQKYIFSGRFIQGWVKQGFETKVIWELKKEGFLSYDFYGSSAARARGEQDFYYISQNTAKAIWREMH